jgi:hypothetical protein
MKKKISVFLLILFTGLLLHLYIRSTTLDESVTIASKEINPILVTITHDYTIGWGPHGLRFWVYTDHQPVDNFAEDLLTPKREEAEFIFESDVYEYGSSWGWPIKSFWNKHGFWFSHQQYEWSELQHRWMILLAVPFWLPLSISISLLITCLVSLRKENHGAQPSSTDNDLHFRGIYSEPHIPRQCKSRLP